jgi:hypothetical protein
MLRAGQCLQGQQNRVLLVGHRQPLTVSPASRRIMAREHDERWKALADASDELVAATLGR